MLEDRSSSKSTTNIHQQRRQHIKTKEIFTMNDSTNVKGGESTLSQYELARLVGMDQMELMNIYLEVTGVYRRGQSGYPSLKTV